MLRGWCKLVPGEIMIPHTELVSKEKSKSWHVIIFFFFSMASMVGSTLVTVVPFRVISESYMSSNTLPRWVSNLLRCTGTASTRDSVIPVNSLICCAPYRRTTPSYSSTRLWPIWNGANKKIWIFSNFSLLNYTFFFWIWIFYEKCVLLRYIMLM